MTKPEQMVAMLSACLKIASDQDSDDTFVSLLEIALKESIARLMTEWGEGQEEQMELVTEAV